MSIHHDLNMERPEIGAMNGLPDTMPGAVEHPPGIDPLAGMEAPFANRMAAEFFPVESELNDEQLTGQIQEMIAAHYDLGPLVHIKQILGGTVNRSFALCLGSDCRRTYFLREYNPNISELEIRFEHALLIHLREHGFTIAACPIPQRDGATYLLNAVQGRRPSFWALFDFLEGEDAYSWYETDLTDAEFASAAQILAQLHHAGRDFVKPPGAGRAQPPIAEFIPTLAASFSRYSREAGERRCDRLFLEHLPAIFRAIDAFWARTDDFAGMPRLAVHCDYHPGNLKYKDQIGVGVFDFDWSKIDYRVFDVALALVYFTSRWEGKQAGSLRLDKFTLFLREYNEACRRQEGLAPLDRRERDNLPPMVAAGNLYVLNWDLSDFYEGCHDAPDDDEYYRYIEHNILLMHWIEAHAGEIRQAIDRALDTV